MYITFPWAIKMVSTGGGRDGSVDQDLICVAIPYKSAWPSCLSKPYFIGFELVSNAFCCVKSGPCKIVNLKKNVVCAFNLSV